MISPARQARVAAVAAVIASASDLLLLYVANAQRSEFGLPEAGRAWLWLGGAIGAVAIPFYALGYRAAAGLVAAASVRAARWLFLAGAAGAALGSVIHGLTAAQTRTQLAASTPAGDPLASLVSGGPLLLTLWSLAALLVGAASALFFWFVSRGGTVAPRAASLSNPGLLTVVLAAAGLPHLLLRSFLTPAAPNIAHLLFFGVCYRILRVAGPGGRSGGEEERGSAP